MAAKHHLACCECVGVWALYISHLVLGWYHITCTTARSTVDPLFRTSEMRASRFNRYFVLVQIVFPLTAIHYNPWNADTPLFRKVDRFFSPFSTWTVQNLLDNAVAHFPLTQVCPPLLINSTTGYYNNSTGIHSTSLWSAFLASV